MAALSHETTDPKSSPSGPSIRQGIRKYCSVCYAACSFHIGTARAFADTLIAV